MGAVEDVSRLQGSFAGETAGEQEQANHTDRVIFAMVGVSAAVSWLGIVPRVGGIDLLAVTAVLGGGWTVFREAFENLLARRMTMELSMTLALVAALAIPSLHRTVHSVFRPGGGNPGRDDGQPRPQSHPRPADAVA